MSIFAELKRRNVVRVSVLYGLAAWLILQVADVLVPALGLPDWVMRFVALLLILGFPLVFIFSWVYELTPEGLKKQHEVDLNQSITHETGRKINYLIGALAVLAIAVVVLERFVPRTAPDAAATGAAPVAAPAQAPVQAASPSIAVLPFADMSAGKDQEYFADGLSEELLNLLAKLPELRVIGRTSSFQFKGRNEDLRVIGEKLNVAHILEGSVRKSGEKVRITAQLIKATDGSHLWSETYDRTLDDIFVVQDEIAGEVVKALEADPARHGAHDTFEATGLGGVQPRLAGAFLSRPAQQRDHRACDRILPSGRASATPGTRRPGRACRGPTRTRPTSVSCRPRTVIDGRARPRKRRWRSTPNSLRRIWRWAGFKAATTGTGRPRTPAIAGHWTWSRAAPRPSGSPASRRRPSDA